MKKRRDERKPILLYDGECGFCLRWVTRMKRRGAEQTVSFHPCQAAVEVRTRARLSETDCRHSAILVEGDAQDRVIRINRGAAAINGVLARLPGRRNWFWRAMGRLYHLPGLTQVEEAVYRVIARNRHRLGGDSCKV